MSNVRKFVPNYQKNPIKGTESVEKWWKIQIMDTICVLSLPEKRERAFCVFGFEK